MKKAGPWIFGILLIPALLLLSIIRAFVLPSSPMFRDYQMLRPGITIRQFSAAFPYDVGVYPDMEWVPTLTREDKKILLKSKPSGYLYLQGTDDSGRFMWYRFDVKKGAIATDLVITVKGKPVNPRAEEILSPTHDYPIKWIELKDVDAPEKELTSERFQTFTGELSAMEFTDEGLRLSCDFVFKDGRLKKATHVVDDF